MTTPTPPDAGREARIREALVRVLMESNVADVDRLANLLGVPVALSVQRALFIADALLSRPASQEAQRIVRGTGFPFTPAMVNELREMIEKVPNINRACEMLAEARTALAAVGAPHSPETTNQIYYPLLFLCEAVDPVLRWLNEDDDKFASAATPIKPHPPTTTERGE